MTETDGSQIADLDLRIAAFQDTVSGLPARQAELQATERDLRRARADRDAAEQRVAAAEQAVLRATLPRPQAWWALLTGRYVERRDAVRAGAQAARADAAAGTEEVSRLASRTERLAAGVRAAEGARTTLTGLIEARAVALLCAADDPRLREVRRLETEIADAGDQAREVDEACGAVRAALAAVEETQRKLSSAHAWGTYDTFFGGGVISSAVKHNRIDAANRSALDVRRSLERVRAELADVRMGLDATHLQIGGMTRGLDLWFDNVFTDWAVQSRIKDQQATVGEVGDRLTEVLRRLDGARRDLEARQTGAMARRRDLLARV